MNPNVTGTFISGGKGVKLGLIFACILIMNPSTLLCRELTGTVYADHSGRSGNGTGEVQLSTKTGLVPIS